MGDPKPLVPAKAGTQPLRRRSDYWMPACAGMSGEDGPASIVAIHALALLVALLRFHRQRRDRARFQAADRDRLAGLLAKAVGAIVDAPERFVDLGDQLALAVARAQLDGAIGFR